MLERADLEIAAQLAIDADEEIPVEGRGHPERIVVGQQELALRLDEVRADEERVARRQHGANLPEKLVGAGPIEVPDVRAEEQHEGMARRMRGGANLGEARFVGSLVRHDTETLQLTECARGCRERRL